MKVMVTGHLGYIGSVMVPMLLNEGYDVIGYDSGLFRDCIYFDELANIPEIIKDIRDVSADDLKGVDAIIHLAGLSNDPLGNLNPNLTYEINYKATVKLAKIAKKVGVKRFIFSSSCSTYGASGEDFKTEESDLRPVTPYAWSKVFAEQELMMLGDTGFVPVVLRNATAYGVSPVHRFDLVINNLVAHGVTTNQILLKSDGTPWRPVVHIRDISRAFIESLKAPDNQIKYQALNVGTNEQNYRIIQLAEIVSKFLPHCEINYVDKAEPDKRNYRVDFTKIKKVLPYFIASWNANSGVIELNEKYNELGLTLNEVEGPKYNRILHIKELINNKKLSGDLRWVQQKTTQRIVTKKTPNINHPL